MSGIRAMQRMLFNVRDYVLFHAYIKHRSYVREFNFRVPSGCSIELKSRYQLPTYFARSLSRYPITAAGELPQLRESGAGQVWESTNPPSSRPRSFLCSSCVLHRPRKGKERKEEKKNLVVAAQCRINRTRERSRSPRVIPERGIFIAGGGEGEGNVRGKVFTRISRGRRASRVV